MKRLLALRERETAGLRARRMSRVASRLRDEVYRANMELAGSGLVSGTFGNVSGVDRAAGLFLIKPSGVPYAKLTPADSCRSRSRPAR